LDPYAEPIDIPCKIESHISGCVNPFHQMDCNHDRHNSERRFGFTGQIRNRASGQIALARMSEKHDKRTGSFGL
jgi:hypothetical protein